MAYKSKYYDPQKAHEYYMKHRKLKGRRSKLSVAKMSNKGKRIASYVKSEISNRRKAELAKHTESVKVQREQLRTNTSTQLNEIQKKITQINNNSSLSNNQKAVLRGELKEKLAKVKSNYLSQKEALSTSSKAQKEKIRADYNKTYENEFKKIKADKSLRKRTKKKRTRKRR